MQNKKDIKIILVEDQKLFAYGLKEVLNKFDNVRVIKIIEDGDLLINELKDHEADVIFLDLNLPKKNGLAILSEIRAQYPDILIIILTMYQEKVLVEKARKLGANGYLTKDVSIEELKETIFLNTNSPFYISKNIRELVKTPNRPEKGTTIITDREKDVLKHLIKGQTLEEVSNTLNINIKTIETHIKNIHRKLNTNTTAELINDVISKQII